MGVSTKSVRKEPLKIIIKFLFLLIFHYSLNCAYIHIKEKWFQVVFIKLHYSYCATHTYIFIFLATNLLRNFSLPNTHVTITFYYWHTYNGYGLKQKPDTTMSQSVSHLNVYNDNYIKSFSRCKKWISLKNVNVDLLSTFNSWNNCRITMVLNVLVFSKTQLPLIVYPLISRRALHGVIWKQKYSLPANVISKLSRKWEQPIALTISAHKHVKMKLFKVEIFMKIIAGSQNWKKRTGDEMAEMLFKKKKGECWEAGERSILK